MSGNDKTKNNDFKIKYKVNKLSNIRIFGKLFVKNNKDNCRIIYKKKEYELVELFDNIEKNNNKSVIIIYLRILNDLTDMSYMLYGCDSLISIPKILPPKPKISNIKKIDDEFAKEIPMSEPKEEEFGEKFNLSGSKSFYADCHPTLAKLEISEIKLENPSKILGESKILENEVINLSLIKDLSEIDTSKVTNMEYLFYGCESLISLPDISKWNTSNVTDMSFMFYCTSLASIPDISKWNTSKVKDMSGFFIECKSLLSLPDISKWNTSNVTSMK